MMIAQHPGLLASLLGLLFGGYFAFEERFVTSSFATNDAMIWTLPLVSYIFLALASTGVSMLYAYGKINRIDAIEQNQSILLNLALALLAGAMAALAIELGSPQRLYWLLVTPNLSSPIWWMGTLYSIELGLLVLKRFMPRLALQLMHEQQLMLLTLMVAIAASLVLGSVFGTVVGREGFGGLDDSLLTLLAALSTGIAVLLLIDTRFTSLFYRAAAQRIFALIGLFILAKWLYLSSTTAVESQWLSVWQVIALATAWAMVKQSPRAAAALLLAGLLTIELGFVSQGQSGVLGPQTTWFGQSATYWPNTSEIGIAIFGVSVAALIFNFLAQLESPMRQP